MRPGMVGLGQWENHRVTVGFATPKVAPLD